jgi:DNA mismatch endonuclease (patch repair protein)
MRRQRRRDTNPELLVRRRLHQQGLRYRVDFRPSKRSRARGDIVFTRAKVVVFVHGCFWHDCPEHGTLPKNNREWWRSKLRANVERDERTQALLEEEGWTCLRFWEHEDPDECADRIACAVAGEQFRELS